MQIGKTGIELPTFWLEADRSIPSATAKLLVAIAHLSIYSKDQNKTYFETVIQ